MSAPDTNVEKQERRHKTPLTALKGSVVIAVLLLVGFMFYTAAQSGDGQDAAITDTVPTVDTTVDN